MKENDPCEFEDYDRLTHWVDPLAETPDGETEISWHMRELEIGRLKNRQRRRIVKDRKTGRIALARVAMAVRKGT
jgi:hypothetical protein